MQKRTKITMASALVVALASSALVASVAFAAAPATTTPKPAAMSAAVDKDNVDFQSESQADDATEVQTPEGGASAEVAGVESEKRGVVETDGIDHQFDGQETGNNGDGVEAPGASTK